MTVFVRGIWYGLMKRLMNLDYENIVLISHLDTTKDITKKGGDKLTSIKPNIADKIANKVAGMVDIVARTIADDGEYVLSFKRNEVIFGGGRLQFKATEIPLNYVEFCGLYSEANGIAAPNVPSQNLSFSAPNVPCEDTKEETPEEPEPMSIDGGVEEAPRRRRRRTE